MNYKIYKYDFHIDDTVEIRTHDVIKLLKIGKQNPEQGVLTAWIIVDTDSEPDEDAVRLRVFGTGQPILSFDHFNNDLPVSLYIDTVQDGQFVWHVFHADYPEAGT